MQGVAPEIVGQVRRREAQRQRDESSGRALFLRNRWLFASLPAVCDVLRSVFSMSEFGVVELQRACEAICNTLAMSTQEASACVHVLCQWVPQWLQEVEVPRAQQGEGQGEWRNGSIRGLKGNVRLRFQEVRKYVCEALKAVSDEKPFAASLSSASTASHVPSRSQGGAAEMIAGLVGIPVPPAPLFSLKGSLREAAR